MEMTDLTRIVFMNEQVPSLSGAAEHNCRLQSEVFTN